MRPSIDEIMNGTVKQRPSIGEIMNGTVKQRPSIGEIMNDTVKNRPSIGEIMKGSVIRNPVYRGRTREHSNEVDDLYAQFLNAPAGENMPALQSVNHNLAPIDNSPAGEIPVPNRRSTDIKMPLRFNERDTSNEILLPQIVGGAVSGASVLPRAGQWGAERAMNIADAIGFSTPMNVIETPRGVKDVPGEKRTFGEMMRDALKNTAESLESAGSNIYNYDIDPEKGASPVQKAAGIIGGVAPYIAMNPTPAALAALWGASGNQMSRDEIRSRLIENGVDEVTANEKADDLWQNIVDFAARAGGGYLTSRFLRASEPALKNVGKAAAVRGTESTITDIFEDIRSDDDVDLIKSGVSGAESAAQTLIWGAIFNAFRKWENQARITAKNTGNNSELNSFYQILGVRPGASADEIKSAFRRFTKVYHPDINKSPYVAGMYSDILKAYDGLRNANFNKTTSPAPQQQAYHSAGKNQPAQAQQQRNVYETLQKHASVGNQPVTSHTTNETDFTKGKKLRSINDLVSALDKSDYVRKNSASFFVDYAPVTADEAVRIKNATGIDVTGYQHVIQANAIQHTLNRHGVNGTTLKDFKNQVPIIESDFELIPIIVKNPDDIVSGKKNKLGQDLIVYKKRIGSDYVFVEEVRTGRKKLSMATMWKNTVKNKPQPLSQTHKATVPDSTADNVITALNQNIPLSYGNVKNFDNKTEKQKINVLNRNLNNGHDAMERVLLHRTIEPDAIRRDDIGSISFYYGTPGTSDNFDGGWGLSNILLKEQLKDHDRNTVAKSIVETIARGDITEKSENDYGEMARILHDGNTVVLVKSWNDGKWRIDDFESSIGTSKSIVPLTNTDGSIREGYFTRLNEPGDQYSSQESLIIEGIRNKHHPASSPEQRILDNMKSRSDDPRTTYQKLLDFKDNYYQQTFDQYSPFKYITQTVADRLNVPIDQVPDNMNLYAYFSTMQGANAVADRDANYFLEPLKVAKLSKEDGDALNLYLGSVRAIDYYETGRLPGLGASQASHRQIIKNTHPEIIKLAEKLQERYNNVIKRHLVGSGMMSSKQYEAMAGSERNRNYVPFHRLMDNKSGDSLKYWMSNPTHRAPGVGDELLEMPIQKPIEAMIENIVKTVMLAEKNKIGKVLIRIANLKDMRWLAKPTSPVELSTRNDSDGNTKPVFIYNEPQEQNIFWIWRDGKKEYYETDPEIYSIITTLIEGEKDHSIAYNTGVSLANVFRKMTTAWNPGFLFSKIMREGFQTAIYSKDWKAIPLVDTFKGLITILKARRGDNEALKLVNSAIDAGVFYSGITDEQQFGTLREIEREAAKLMGQRGMIGGTLDAASAVLGKIVSLNQAVEVAPKLTEFMRMRGLGYGEKAAAAGARPINIDFYRRGSKIGWYNRLTPFLNVNLQAIDLLRKNYFEGSARAISKLLKGDFKDAWKHGEHPVKVWMKSFLWIGLPTIIMWAIANSDENREAEYTNIPRQIRDSHFVFKISDTWIRLPAAYGPTGVIFKGGIERILDGMYQKDPETARMFARNVIASSATSLTPNYVNTFFELTTGYDLFRGRPIIPRNQAELPSEMQYGPETTSASRMIGETFGVAPFYVDHAINGIIGSLMIDILKGFDIASGMKPDAPARRVSDIPFTRRFTTNPDRYGEWLDRFIEKSQEARSRHNLYEARRNAGWSVNLSKEDEQFLNIFIPRQREMNYLRGKRLSYQEGKDLSPQEKRKKIDEVDREIAEVARKTMQRYYRLQQGLPVGGRR